MRLQAALVAAQEIGDEKLQVVQLLQDLIDNKQRSLEGDHKKLGKLQSSVGIINDSQIQFIHSRISTKEGSILYTRINKIKTTEL